MPTAMHAPSADSFANESLAAQADLLADCAATLFPDGSLDVACYDCTSGSLVIGEERVFTMSQSAITIIGTTLEPLQTVASGIG